MSAGEDDTEAEATARWLRPRIVQGTMGRGGRGQQKPIRFTRASRKHRIGRAHALLALENAGEPVVLPADDVWTTDRLRWVGTDDRGLELEIVTIDRPDCTLVIHVMPTAFKEQS